MTPRDNLLRALRREGPDYVPWGMDMCEQLQAELCSKYHTESFWEYFNLPYRHIPLRATALTGQYDRYYRNIDLKPGTVIDEWGIAQVPAGFAHFTKMLHPMEAFTEPEQVWTFPLPDILADYRWAQVSEQVEAVKKQGLLAVYFAVQVFEPAWYLRGLENMLMDLYDESPMAEACLERICGIQEAFCRRLAECGYDMIVYGDDVGTQKSLMLSKPIWEKYLKPTMKRCIAAAKTVNPSLLAYYHSDGNILEIIPDLIDIGVDVLNPIQPECMDPIQIKRQYGDQLSFWGTIGTQTTMPFGSPEQVEEKVAEMIETVGSGGGLVIAPTHLLEPEVPLENIYAFYRAVLKFGKYRK